MEMKPESAAMRRSLVIFMRAFFCAVAGVEIGLELFVQAIIGEMGVKLGTNIFFQDFGNERKVRNGAKVIEVAGV